MNIFARLSESEITFQ